MQALETKSRGQRVLGAILVISLCVFAVGVLYREEAKFEISRANNIIRSWSCSAGAFPSGPSRDGCVCKKCPKGHRCRGGNSPPRRCNPGTYQSLLGQNVCIPSPKGKFVPGYAAHSATNCNYGHYQDQTGRSRCKAARPGYKVDRRGATAPKKCSRGRYQNRHGQRSCKLAPLGTYVNHRGATRGTPCHYGYYQNRRGQTSCKVVPPGTYANRRGLQRPLQCNVNTFQHCSGQIGCIPCPQGQYQPRRGRRRCISRGNVCPRFCSRACGRRPRRLEAKPAVEEPHEIAVADDSNLVVTQSTASAQLRKTSGCPITALPIVRSVGRNQVMVTGAILPNCLIVAEPVFLYNSRNGRYEFNAVTRKVRSGRSHRLYLQRPMRTSYTQVVRAVYSSSNIVVRSHLTSSGFNGNTGGVLVLWSKANVYIQGSLQMSGKGFRGGNVRYNIGPETNTGRVRATNGGGGGGCPGHGCSGRAGWHQGLIGRGTYGGGNPFLHRNRVTCVGGSGSAGGGGGGSGYGYDGGRGGPASRPGGAGGSKSGNNGHGGASANGPSGGGGGGGGSRDNGGGGGGAKPVNTRPNHSNGNSLLLGAGSASGAGGGGGGGAGDYQCARGGNAGSPLGRGGRAGTDTCRHRARSSTNGQNGSNGSPGGGLIVIVARNVVRLGRGVIVSTGGVGGNGGRGGLGGVTNCATGGGAGSGGGGGGAQGASGGTVVFTGRSNNVPVNVAGGRGGRGGLGGRGGGRHRHRSYGHGGNGASGRNGFGGRHFRIGGAPSLNVPSCNCNCR